MAVGDEGRGGRDQRDLVLNTGQFAHLQDTTQGVIKTHVGPLLVNQTGTEQPIKYDHIA